VTDISWVGRSAILTEKLRYVSGDIVTGAPELCDMDLMYGSRGAIYLKLRMAATVFPFAQEKDTKTRLIVSTLCPRFGTFSVTATIPVVAFATAKVFAMFTALVESASAILIAALSAHCAPLGFHLKKSLMTMLTVVPIPPETGDIDLMVGSRVSYSMVKVSSNVMLFTLLFVLSSGEYAILPLVDPL
jgi:hypothetical protein